MIRPAAIHQSAIRASDADRELVLDVLREHWLAGRLAIDEFEDRCDEVTASKYQSQLGDPLRELPPLPRPTPPVAPASSRGSTSFVLGIVGLCILMFSMGLLFMLSLPISAGAWLTGRSTRRRTGRGRGTMASAGETMGIIGTIIGCLALSAFALIIAKVS